jgi:undecaprenyl-diphosphatase
MLYIALLLGLIEGMTEFIPVSSTGHLILFGDILKFQGPPGKTFEISIQLGAILAICWLYRGKLAATTSGLIKREAKDWSFAIGILLAFLPAMVLGALFHEFIKEKLFWWSISGQPRVIIQLKNFPFHYVLRSACANALP